MKITVVTNDGEEYVFANSMFSVYSEKESNSTFPPETLAIWPAGKPGEPRNGPPSAVFNARAWVSVNVNE